MKGEWEGKETDDSGSIQEIVCVSYFNLLFKWALRSITLNKASGRDGNS